MRSPAASDLDPLADYAAELEEAAAEALNCNSHYKEFQPTEDAAVDRRLIDRDTIERLATMHILEYDRLREAEAERLGVRVSALDRAVAAARAAFADGAGRAFKLENPEPWPEPVNGAALLDELAEQITAHVSLPPAAADTVALWVIHTHAHDTAAISPILAITSPTPECGKTTLLTLLGALVPRALEASSITTAALFRAVEKWRPTLLIDEADTFLKDNDELRGVLNSGHCRASAQVIRTAGEDHEPRAFATWAPKAIATIGKLHPTISSRSILIEMKRLAAGEHVEPLRGDRLQQFQHLKRKAWRWAQDHARTLERADPELPQTLRGRAADNWRPLISLADAAGGPWPERARRAAEASAATANERSAAELLLEDIKNVFAERGVDRLPSAELAAALAEIEDRPWPEWSRGKPITKNQLTRMLKPFGIPSGTIRMSSGLTIKGFYLDNFTEAFARYLPKSSQRHNPHKTAKNDLFNSSQADNVVTISNQQKPQNSAACDVVTISNPHSEEDERTL